MHKIKITLLTSIFLLFPALAFSLTNADLSELLSAGMSESVVLNAVQTDKNPQYDVSVSSIIALKKAGASDAVLTAIQNKSKKEEAPNANAVTPNSMAANSNNMMGDGRLLVITDKGGVDMFVEQETYGRPSFASILSRGLIREQRAIFIGTKATNRLTNKPLFETSLEPNLNPVTSMYIVKHEIDETSKRREVLMKFNRGGALVNSNNELFNAEVNMALNVEEIQDSAKTMMGRKLYRFTPKEILPAGEYGVYINRQFFNFGVD